MQATLTGDGRQVDGFYDQTQCIHYDVGNVYGTVYKFAGPSARVLTCDCVFAVTSYRSRSLVNTRAIGE